MMKANFSAHVKIFSLQLSSCLLLVDVELIGDIRSCFLQIYERNLLVLDNIVANSTDNRPTSFQQDFA